MGNMSGWMVGRCMGGMDGWMTGCMDDKYVGREDK